MFREYNIAWGDEELIAGPCITSLPLPPPKVHDHPLSFTTSCTHYWGSACSHEFFYSSLERWLRAVWHEMIPQTVEWRKGGGGQFLSDGILLSSFLLCLLPRVSGWHLSSALYTMIQRRLDAKSELVEFTETITLLMKRVLLLYLFFCVCMSVNQEKSSTCWAGQLLQLIITVFASVFNSIMYL